MMTTVNKREEIRRSRKEAYDASVEAAAKRVAARLPDLTLEQREHLSVLLGGGTDLERAPVVYFIGGGDRIKIGTSIDLPGRLKALRASSPIPLNVLIAIPGSNAEEKEMHARFSHLRLHGEWFAAEPDLLNFIAKLGGSCG